MWITPLPCTIVIDLLLLRLCVSRKLAFFRLFLASRFAVARCCCFAAFLSFLLFFAAFCFCSGLAASVVIGGLSDLAGSLSRFLYPLEREYPLENVLPVVLAAFGHYAVYHCAVKLAAQQERC